MGEGVADLTTEYLYQREVDRVLAALMPQNQLIVRVMLQTGMRLSDALRMPSEGLVGSGWYTEGKTGKNAATGFLGPFWRQLGHRLGPCGLSLAENQGRTRRVKRSGRISRGHPGRFA